jgi:dephospho-CoA kinase
LRIIGLTGNIGSGKSTAADYFQALGAKIISADQLARDVVSVNQPAYLEIVQQFGKEILQPDLSINRKKLADIVFKNEERLNHLNRITHREIRKLKEKLTRTLYKSEPESTVIYDVPLLFENDMQHSFQKTILITINPDIQIDRLVKGRQMNVNDVKARLSHQMPQNEKIALADIVIENNTSTADLKSKIKGTFKEILLLSSLELKSIKH